MIGIIRSHFRIWGILEGPYISEGLGNSRAYELGGDVKVKGQVVRLEEDSRVHD